MANKIIPLLFLSMLLVGCSTTPDPQIITKIETVEVYKPVFEVPEELKNFPKLNRPDLPSNHLEQGDEERPGHVAKVIVESMAILREYAEALEDQIEAYNKALNEAEAKSKKELENTDLIKD